MTHTRMKAKRLLDRLGFPFCWMPYPSALGITMYNGALGLEAWVVCICCERGLSFPIGRAVRKLEKGGAWVIRHECQKEKRLFVWRMEGKDLG